LPTDFSVKVTLVERVPLNEVIEYYTRRKKDLCERTISVFEIIFKFIMGQNYEIFQRKLFDLNTTTSSPKVMMTIALFTTLPLTTTYPSLSLCRFNWPSLSVASPLLSA